MLFQFPSTAQDCRCIGGITDIRDQGNAAPVKKSGLSLERIWHAGDVSAGMTVEREL